MKRVIFFKLFLMLATVISISAATIVVDLAGGGDYTNIRDAVDAASDGDTVLVMSGTFIISAADGQITISREIHLQGSGYDLPEDGGTYIQADAAVFYFDTGADESTLRGFRIKGYGNSMIAIEADDMIIENNHLTNTMNQGVLMSFSSTTADTVRNNIIGFSNGPNLRTGLSIAQAVDLTVTNNIFFHCSYYGAVYTYNTTNTLISNNLFLSNDIGVYVTGSGTNIVNNIFMNGPVNNSNQIYIYTGSPSISYNCFYNNLNDGSVGIEPIRDNPDFVDFGDNDTYTYQSIDDDGFDFHLQGSSPCIDAGNPLFDYFDLDGSRNDLGVYGWKFPIGTIGAPTIPVVNSISVTPSTVSPSGTITINASGRIGD